VSILPQDEKLSVVERSPVSKPGVEFPNLIGLTAVQTREAVFKICHCAWHFRGRCALALSGDASLSCSCTRTNIEPRSIKIGENSVRQQHSDRRRLVALNFRVPLDLRRRLKVLAASRSITMTNLFLELLERFEREEERLSVKKD
jgi:hypothetical protein